MLNSASATRDGRITSVSTTIHGKKIRLTSAYAHSDMKAAERPAFFSGPLKRRLTRNTVMGIDANVVPDETLDLQRVGAGRYNNQGADELADAISQAGLVDVIRESLGRKPFFTSHHNVHAQGGGPTQVTHTRIDQIYAPDINGLIWQHEPLDDPFLDTRKKELDHCTIAISIDEARGKRGNDIATINEAIYDNATFLKSIHDHIEFTIRVKKPQASHTWGETWTQIKENVLEMSKKETKRKAYKDNIETKRLKKKRDALKTAIDSGKANASEIAEYIRLAPEISKSIREEKALYETIEDVAYSTGKKHDVGSAAMYRPYKPKGSAQWINETAEADWTDISKPTFNGQKCTDASQQAHAATPYWKTLFTKRAASKESAKTCLRLLTKGKTVLPPSAKKCGALITTEEVRDICNTLPTGKSAGPDRLPNKLYKNMSSVIAPIIAAVANESKEKKCYPPGFSSGLISLLYKKGDRCDPRNYRPITLLNGDYKIIMRALTRRMNDTVGEWVSRFQSGFVPDAFLAENIMLLNLAQTYAEENNEDAYFLFLDMEKAFDRCSWAFLTLALKRIGYDDDFIDYIKLAYNHDTPPKRQLSVNGYLGPQFSLESGVAQGCPCSPLLFLLITEPLSRLFETDIYLEGLTIGKLKLVISQFADDTTLVLRKGDSEHAQKLLDTWCKATTMAENFKKREGMLVGPWNKTRQGTPTGVIEGDKWLADGKHIRALGAPLGNDLDEEAWYTSRYRTVKNRIGQWPSLRRHSITGRNMLVQSILYGSFRFWLYFMIMPQSVIKLIEQDAKQILWATEPRIATNEMGSEAAHRWIAEAASYLPTKKGGAGIMHWQSHCEAFYAHWIIRYLHPRKAPWKDIASIWIDDAHIGPAIIMTSSVPDDDLMEDIPKRAHYLRRCMRAFLSLKIKQNLEIEDLSIIAEPIWHNRRYDIDVRKLHRWQEQLSTNRLYELLTDKMKPFTRDEWDAYFDQVNPNPAYTEWKNVLHDGLDEIKRKTRKLIKNVTRPPLPEEGWVALVPKDGGDNEYAKRVASVGSTKYELALLDIHGRPHLTGEDIKPGSDYDVECVETWESHSDSSGGSSSEGEDDKPPKPPPAIMGPRTATYPRNIGWHLPTETPVTPGPKARHRTLSDITIKTITKHFTSYINEGVKPNCITNWPKFVDHTRHIPFDKVFASFGTPLSDPTEERQWRKLVHRATFVRNRDPKLADHNCRLCNKHVEQIHTLFQCEATAPLWHACIEFTKKILKGPEPT